MRFKHDHQSLLYLCCMSTQYRVELWAGDFGIWKFLSESLVKIVNFNFSIRRLYSLYEIRSQSRFDPIGYLK